MHWIKTFIFPILLTLIFITPSYTNAQLPTSREATLLEVVSSSEVLYEATGIYLSPEKRKRKRKKDVKKNGEAKAILDAKKAAIYSLIYNGTDPILDHPDEIERFNAIQNDFFSKENIKDMVVYSSSRPKEKISLQNGEGIKVIIDVKINKDYVLQLLEENLVIFSKEELVENLGYPQIIVIPQVQDDQNPLELLYSDNQLQHAAGVIESYLTSKQFDVIIPDRLNTINELSKALSNAKEITQDSSYQIALTIGSDIYLDYSVSSSDAAYNTQQFAVTVRAYETTTGRLLGTETGYSKPRIGEDYLSIEEALLSALSNTISRLMTYWEDDLYRGIQYKVITYIDANKFTEESIFDLQENLLDIMEKISFNIKENIITDGTMDVNLWCNHEVYQRSRDLYKDLRKAFKEKETSRTLKLINQNRKLLLLSIE